MGRRGPKPIPTVIKMINGNPGKRPLNKNEPRPREGVIEPPRELGAVALEEWRRIVPELESCHLLTKADRAALIGYCAAYEAWVLAKRKLNRDGRFYKHGKLIKVHPGVAVEKEALALMLRYLAEFGLSPASRSRVNSEPPAEPSEEDKFFDAV